MSEPPTFASELLAWHALHGRHDLPWQRSITPYRVWISEVMLQQTQVATVMPYFERFMQRFPSVQALAAAPLDEVLHLWSGLGYYSRARNLQRAAQRIFAEFGGELPGDAAQLSDLPGIGRSTAAAILALSHNRRHAILDGNVRRVLTRYFAVEGPVTDGAVQKRLWALAEQCTPAEDVARYTQAIMDLGATVCVRSRPLCIACPLQTHCRARQRGLQHRLPTPKPRAARRLRSVIMLVAQRNDGSVLLQRRPERGIWGGLWCLPEFHNLDGARAFSAQYLRRAQVAHEALAQVRHAFTHFELEITPLLARCEGSAGIMEGTPALWYKSGAPQRIGLPAPIQQMLDSLQETA